MLITSWERQMVVECVSARGSDHSGMTGLVDTPRTVFSRHDSRSFIHSFSFTHSLIHFRVVGHNHDHLTNSLN